MTTTRLTDREIVTIVAALRDYGAPDLSRRIMEADWVQVRENAPPPVTVTGRVVGSDPELVETPVP